MRLVNTVLATVEYRGHKTTVPFVIVNPEHQRFSLSGGGQNIASYALTAARDSAIIISAFSAHSASSLLVCLAAKRRCTYSTSVDILNTLCKATVAHSERHTNREQWFCSETENSAIAAIVEPLRLILR